ncbi:MAG: PASTA domain-containing protein [Thermoleophilia bacterium]|nr:PASTA domain-containing protein [Thermoleophilia bacterium]
MRTLAVRLAFLIVVWLLGTATLTLAQDAEAPAETPPAAPPEPATTETLETGPLLVPDVRGLPYVFAKGVLEDAGFAWKVKGKVEGYATNLVKEQSVKPGTQVVDTGAPTIVLELEANPEYDERGVPQAASPYAGSELVPVSGGEAEGTETAPRRDDEASEERGETGTEAESASEGTEPAQAEESPAAEGGDEGQAAPETIDAEQASAASPAASEPAAEPAKSERQRRPRAFVAPGAPREPRDEIPLPQRARNLERRIAAAAGPSDALAEHFLYQHAWVVTGARFGWWRGAEALRVLIRVDEEVQRRFGWSGSSEAEARAALAEVRRLSTP